MSGKTWNGGKSNNDHKFRRTKEQKERDKAYIADLYVKGYTIMQMRQMLIDYVKEHGDSYELSFQQIHYDCRQMMIEWKRTQLDTINEYLELELIKLDKIEAELWEAWEKSKQPKTKTSYKGASLDVEGKLKQLKRGRKADLEITVTPGAVKYLDSIMKVLERRAKLLGYEAYAGIKKDDEDKKVRDVSNVPQDLLIEVANKMQGIN